MAKVIVVLEMKSEYSPVVGSTVDFGPPPFTVQAEVKHTEVVEPSDARVNEEWLRRVLGCKLEVVNA